MENSDKLGGRRDSQLARLVSGKLSQVDGVSGVGKRMTRRPARVGGDQLASKVNVEVVSIADQTASNASGSLTDSSANDDPFDNIEGGQGDEPGDMKANSSNVANSVAAGLVAGQTGLLESEVPPPADVFPAPVADGLETVNETDEDDPRDEETGINISDNSSGEIASLETDGADDWRSRYDGDPSLLGESYSDTSDENYPQTYNIHTDIKDPTPVLKTSNSVILQSILGNTNVKQNMPAVGLDPADSPAKQHIHSDRSTGFKSDLQTLFKSHINTTSPPLPEVVPEISDSENILNSGEFSKTRDEEVSEIEFGEGDVGQNEVSGEYSDGDYGDYLDYSQYLSPAQDNNNLEAEEFAGLPQYRDFKFDNHLVTVHLPYNMSGLQVRNFSSTPRVWNAREAFLEQVGYKLYMFIPAGLAGILLGIFLWILCLIVLRTYGVIKRKVLISLGKEPISHKEEVELKQGGQTEWKEISDKEMVNTVSGDISYRMEQQADKSGLGRMHLDSGQGERRAQDQMSSIQSSPKSVSSGIGVSEREEEEEERGEMVLVTQQEYQEWARARRRSGDMLGGSSFRRNSD